MDLKPIIEAVLFSSEKPMTLKQLQDIFPELEQPESQEIEAVLVALTTEYDNHALELKRVASGYRFQVREQFSPWVSRLFEEKPPRYSRALLETLAIIAYRQPVTRGEIEDIRGVVVSSNIIRTLLEREWVKIVAHKEVPGRPALYATTKEFLDYFNLSSLAELPTLQEIQDLNFTTKDGEPLSQTTQVQVEHHESPVQETSTTQKPDPHTESDENGAKSPDRING